MKNETKINDLKTAIASARADGPARLDRSALEHAIKSTTDRERIIGCLDRSIASQQAAAAMAEAFERLPKSRRGLALATKTNAERIGKTAAEIGESYSGKTTCSATWTDKPEPSAITSTGYGDRYSRSCKYSKTDADHTVHLSPDWSPLLVERPEIVQLSARDGLPLIGIAADGRVCWVKRGRGKSITSEIGWIANFGALCYHSTTSQADAEAGMARKLAALRREWAAGEAARADAAVARKNERRARLIARLCGSVTASVADALALGFCRPGIEQFQREHSIGDTASLPQLVKSGNSSAVRLAISIARNVTHRSVA